MSETLNQDSIAETDLFFKGITLEGLLLQTSKYSRLCAVVADSDKCFFCLRRDEMVGIGRSFQQGCHDIVDMLVNVPRWELCKHD